MQISFDNRGNVSPYQRIQISFQEFKTLFVERQEGSTSNRGLILSDYLRYIEDFSELVTPNFVHWINGSFISNRLKPKDIDFVVLVDFETYDLHEELIEKRFRRKNAKEYYGSVDAYVVKKYPLDHSRSFVTEFDLVYWDNWFSETKKNRAKKKFKKGYLEIEFGNKL